MTAIKMTPRSANAISLAGSALNHLESAYDLLAAGCSVITPSGLVKLMPNPQVSREGAITASRETHTILRGWRAGIANTKGSLLVLVRTVAINSSPIFRESIVAGLEVLLSQSITYACAIRAILYQESASPYVASGPDDGFHLALREAIDIATVAHHANVARDELLTVAQALNLRVSIMQLTIQPC